MVPFRVLGSGWWPGIEAVVSPFLECHPEGLATVPLWEDIVKMMRRWPDRYWPRVVVAAIFVLPLTLVGAVVSELIVRWPVDDAVSWFAVFGTAAFVAGTLTLAALARPDTPIQFLPGAK